jgi:hypothetical protein
VKKIVAQIPEDTDCAGDAGPLGWILASTNDQIQQAQLTPRQDWLHHAGDVVLASAPLPREEA